MKRKLSLIIAILLFISLVAGCSSTDDTPPTSKPTVTATPESQSTGDEPASDDKPYPLVESPVTLSCYWLVEATEIVDLSDCMFWQEMANRLNVHIKFDHPASTGGNENFNLIVASQDYPDMMKGFYTSYGPGIDHAIEEEMAVVALNDYVEYLPNYMSFVNGNDEYKIDCYSDNGYLWGINHLAPVPCNPWAGPTVRKDMLDEIGYTKTPITVDDWEDMLTQLRDNFPSLKNGPFMLVSHGGTAAWGTVTAAYGVHSHRNFMDVNGKVVYPMLEPGYKDYLMRMNDWYEKGLIWDDYISEPFIYGPVDKVANGELAVFDSIYNWFESNYAAASDDPNFELMGIPLPKLNENDELHIRQSNAWARPLLSVSIMTTCKDVPLACRYWDYVFTEEGILLSNWGIEDVTFVYDEDGNPRFTDLLLDYEAGVESAMTQYLLFNGPGLLDWKRPWQVVPQAAIDATITWLESANNDWVFPEGAILTSEEGEEYSRIFVDIQTFINENANRFIMGLESFDNFDAFIEEIKEMGIERVIEIKQQSLDRYYNRLNIID
jgi:putative aldouronate transport system substrate-binding protein